MCAMYSMLPRYELCVFACMLQRGHAYDAQNREVPLGSDDKQEAVKKAKTALELYRIIG